MDEEVNQARQRQLDEFELNLNMWELAVKENDFQSAKLYRIKMFKNLLEEVAK